MLYLNGVRFNTKSKDPDYEHQALVKEFHKTIKEAQDQYGTHLLLETRRRPRPDPKTKYPIYPPTRGLLLHSVIIDDEGNTEDWLYSDTILGKLKNSDELDVKNHTLLIEKGQYAIDIKRNPDLVFYALNCGKVGRTIEEGKKFHVHDDAATSKVSAEQRRLESKVGYMIYSAIPDKNLSILAKSWGIGGVDQKTPDEVRELLYNKIVLGEKAKKAGGSGHRGYVEFLESAAVKSNDKVAALCVDAEEKDFLVYDTEQRTWLLDYKDGNTPYRLKELSGGEYGDPISSLVQFLLTDQESLRKIEVIMNRPETELNKASIETGELTMDQVRAENNIMKLKKWIKETDPSLELAKTMKADDAKEILFSLLAANAVG